ncbi:ATPase [Clostridia bacterium]|nr:ATPase [Clostridia bacterium]
MKRIIEENLLAWKNEPKRKPLIIDGARQIGKTYTMLDFGKKNYPNVAYFNFEGNKPLNRIFCEDLNPERIVRELSALSGKSIQKGSALIIFDEIQACPAALTSLKYFCETAPEYHIICAGSLLGIALNRESNAEKISFPVGKTNGLKMYPMNFKEFLWAAGYGDLAALIEESFSNNKPLSEPLHLKALELYKTYILVGGMPECVAEYLERMDFDFMRAKQHKIVADYTADMVKYSDRLEAVRHEAVYNSIPSQLSKENRKFQYGIIKSGARAKDYENSITWIAKAGIALQCFKMNTVNTPAEFYKDMTSYKIYFSDVGLLCSKFAVSPEILLSDFSIGGEAKGALTENYLAQELTAAGHSIYYWESGGRAEVDFVLQIGGKLIPVECKAAENTKSKSLKAYVEAFKPDYSVRVSSKNFGFENRIKSIPLYAASCIANLGSGQVALQKYF